MKFRAVFAFCAVWALFGPASGQTAAHFVAEGTFTEQLGSGYPGVEVGMPFRLEFDFTDDGYTSAALVIQFPDVSNVKLTVDGEPIEVTNSPAPGFSLPFEPGFPVRIQVASVPVTNDLGTLIINPVDIPFDFPGAPSEPVDIEDMLAIQGLPFEKRLVLYGEQSDSVLFGSGTITISPVVPNFCSADVPGDLNGNGELNIVDVQCSIVAVFWAMNGGALPEPGCLKAPAAQADADCSGEITIADTIILQNYRLGKPLGESLDIDANGCPDGCQELPVLEVTVDDEPVTEFDLGSFPEGTSPRPATTFTYTNTGSVPTFPLSVTFVNEPGKGNSIFVQGGGNCPPFDFTINCFSTTTCAGVVLAPGESCTVDITLRTNGGFSGPDSGTLTVLNGDGGVPLSTVMPVFGTITK